MASLPKVVAEMLEAAGMPVPAVAVAAVAVAKRPRPAEEEGEAVERASPPKRARTEPVVFTDEEVRASPFNPEHPKYHSFCDTIQTHLIPYLPPKDAGHLAQQSRGMRECVARSARVSLEQIMHYVKTPELCKLSVELVGSFLKDPFTTATEVMAIVVSTVLNNGDAAVACEIVACIMSQPLLRQRGKTRNTFKLLAMEATLATTWSQRTWSQPLLADDPEVNAVRTIWKMTEAWKVMSTHQCPVVRKAFMLTMKDVQFDPNAAMLNDVGHALTRVLARQAFGPKNHISVGRTRVSGDLLKMMLSSGIVTPISQLAEHRAAFIASIVLSVAELEKDNQDTASEVSAVEFILDTCEFEAAGSDMSETAKCISTTAIEAPILERVRPNVAKSTSRRSSPVTLAIKQGNAASLRSIARLAMAQNISVMAQKRALELAMTRKAFVCLGVLVEEGFAVSPSLLKKTILTHPEAWGAIDRKTAFDTLLTKVEVLAARDRTGLDALVKQFYTPLAATREQGQWNIALKFDVWTATLAGDFLCALWRATDCKGAVRDKVASTVEFRQLVDIVLGAHIFQMFYTIMASMDNPDEFVTKPGAKSLMSRISELFDIQWRCTDVFQPATDTGTPMVPPLQAGEKGPMYGIKFDAWLVGAVLPRIAATSWKAVQLMITMDPTCASCVASGVVHTDNFIRLIFKIPNPKESTVRDVLRAAVTLDPDTEGDGPIVLLARRVLRWAGMFMFGPMRAKVTPGHVAVLEDLACSAESAAPDGVNEGEDLDVRLAAVMNRMKFLIVTAYDKPLGGVQRLYCEYDGDVNAAILALFDEIEDKSSVIEPTGDIRDVLVYAMSGLAEVDVEQKTVLNTVVTYTACVTLPCVLRLKWVVFRRPISEALPTPWIRNVIRGTRPYVRWWATQ